MERHEYMAKLNAWMRSPRRKPLILEGARQVGKTWLMREFAKGCFAGQVYVRFDRDRQLRSIFDRNFDVARIVHELEIAFKTRVEAGKTVLIFDEIQACKAALTSLKYFCEDRPDLHILCAGSLLGLEYRDDETDSSEGGKKDTDTPTTGFPVGKVNTMAVHPLSFAEFTEALGYPALSSAMKDRNWQLLEDFRDTLSDLLKHYFVIGGMPEAVAAYLETRNFLDTSEVHREILSGYRRDFAKHAPKTDVPRIGMVWSSIPAQLAKENRKFVYSAMRKGERAATYREPIAWLEDAGLIHLCRRLSAPRLPLSSYSGDAFKVFALDVGLLATMAGLDSRVVLEGSRIFTEFKGALTEQYVHQQLVSEYGASPFYWCTDDSRTEVDFVIQKGMEAVPIEVKAGENVQSKSLRSYLNRFKAPLAYRASMLPYKEQQIRLEGGDTALLVNLPLYGIR
jgi:predicted AAA+ superfamily ATPase